METLVTDSGAEELWPNVSSPNGRARVHKMGLHHLCHQATVPQAQVYDATFSRRLVRTVWYGSYSHSFDLLLRSSWAESGWLYDLPGRTCQEGLVTSCDDVGVASWSRLVRRSTLT